MRKSVCRMLWTLPVLTMLLINHSILSAQSLPETTTFTERDQTSVDAQQENDDFQSQANVTGLYLYLNNLLPLDLVNSDSNGSDNVYLKNNGIIIWGPEAVSGSNFYDMNTIIPVSSASSVRLELFDKNSGRSLGKISFSFNSLKKIVDKGERYYTFNHKWYSSATWQYKLNYEVKSTDDSSDSIMGLSASADCGGINSPGNPFDCCTNGGNCTWWAWHMAKSTWGVDFPARRNAKYWKIDAQNNKYFVSSTPAVNTIAVNTDQPATINGKKEEYGHVAWVEKITGGTVTVSEMSCCSICGFGPKYGKEYPISYFTRKNGGFIYPQSDLTVSNLSVSPASGSAGTKTTVSFSISNVGKGPSGTSTTNIRINKSSSSVITSDTKLASVSVPSMSSGAMSTFTQTVTIPRNVSAGTYYIWVIADVNRTAYQKDETNDKVYTSFTVN